VYALRNARAIMTDRVILRTVAAGRNDVLAAVPEVENVEKVGDAYVLTLRPDVSPVDVADRISQLPWIVYAEPDIVTVAADPALAATSMQPRAASSDYETALIGADRAWQVVRANPSITLAIVDDGIDARHPDLADIVTAHYDAITDSLPQRTARGTRMARSVPGWPAHSETDGLGKRGVAHGCSLVMVRVAASSYKADVQELAASGEIEIGSSADSASFEAQALEPRRR
jgi:subtilisin family serine protease